MPPALPLAIIEPAGKVLYCNNHFNEKFGIVSGSNLDELNPEPEIKNLVNGLVRNNLKNINLELTLNKDSDKLENYNFYIEHLSLENGNFYVVIISSIEEKFKLESKINSLHNALEYGGVPVIILNEAGVISYSTDSFEKILNCDISKLYNNSIADVLEDYITDFELISLLRALENKTEWAKVLKVYDEVKGTSYKELRLTPIQKSENTGSGFILTGNDITPYITKNKLVKRSENKLRSIINNISDYLLICKKYKDDIFFENANENFCNLFELNKDDSTGKNLINLLDESLYNQVTELVCNIEIDHQKNLEFSYSQSENEYSGTITTAEDVNSNYKLFIIVLRDITERKNYERQLEKAYQKEVQLNMLKNAFLENMTHEIRTPLNALMGYSEFIDDSIKTGDYDTIYELVIAVKDVMNRSLSLLDNIIEISQLESEDINFNYEIINVNKVISSVYKKSLNTAIRKNITLKKELSEEEIKVYVDWVKLEKTISYLIDNSLKYTNEGEILVSVEKVDGCAVIKVLDSGVGIEAEYLDRVTQPFIQAESSPVRSYEGAGLGLTIADRLTRFMGGKLSIASKKNVGTQIILKFPLSINEGGMD